MFAGFHECPNPYSRCSEREEKRSGGRTRRGHSSESGGACTGRTGQRRAVGIPRGKAVGTKTGTGPGERRQIARQTGRIHDRRRCRGSAETTAQLTKPGG